MSVWHRFLVWMCLRHEKQPELEKESPPTPSPIPSPTPSISDRLVKDAKFAAAEVLLLIAKNPKDDIICDFPASDSSVFSTFELFAFEQPGGYRAMFLKSLIHPNYWEASEYYSPLDLQEIHTREVLSDGYNEIRYSRIFENAFFAEFQDVSQNFPSDVVPVVGMRLVRPIRGYEFSITCHKTQLEFCWIQGKPPVTCADGKYYTPENHTELVNRQRAVQEQYRSWLAVRLMGGVHKTALTIVEAFTQYLSNTSHLVTAPNGVIYERLASDDGYVCAFELSSDTLRLLVRDGIKDERYQELAAYVWDSEQFHTAYQGWLRGELERVLLTQTYGVPRWEIKQIPIDHVSGDDRQYISFTLQEKVME